MIQFKSQFIFALILLYMLVIFVCFYFLVAVTNKVHSFVQRETKQQKNQKNQMNFTLIQLHQTIH